MINYSQKLEKIEHWFNENTQKVIVAFSGGVDSCTVAFLARKFLGKENTIAIISSSPSLKQKDLEIANEFCNKYDINLEIIETKEVDDPSYYTNPVDRCYFCKTYLYVELRIIANKYPGSVILNGQNYDDLSDYRPGNKAANEFNVLSPLADCQLSKNDIRELAKYFNLPTWDKPASPCLSSRIPYGQDVTINKLKQIEEAENILNELGFEEVRVRHSNNIARIEVPENRLSELIIIDEEVKNRIIQIGFSECEIDKEGLVSGKLNRVIV